MKLFELKEEKIDLKEETKKDEKTIASVWELLMHSKVHQEALVMALDQKKIPTSFTPEHMVNSLIETPQGAIVFIDNNLLLEGRDHHNALFIKADVKGKLTCCVMVDNGSDINVFPLKILPKFGIDRDWFETV